MFLQEWVLIQSVVLRLPLIKVVGLSMLLVAWIKHHDQNLLVEKRVYFRLQLSGHIIAEGSQAGSWRQELAQRNSADWRSPWLARPALL